MMSESTRRVPMMTLRELVKRYQSLARTSGEPVALFAFGLSATETERLFSGLDEDYHISRFFHFSEADGEIFSINGVSVTHVAIDSEVATIL